MDEIYYGI